MESLADTKTGLVKLRLRGSRGPSENRSDLAVFVAVNIVQHQSRAEALGQLTDGGLEQNAIGHTFEALVGCSQLHGRTSIFFLWVGEFVERSLVEPFFAKAHQHGVAGHSIQPGGERRVTLKITKAAKHSEKSFLSQILSQSNIADHAKTESIDAPGMQPIKPFERVGVSLAGESESFAFSQCTSLRLHRKDPRSSLHIRCLAVRDIKTQADRAPGREQSCGAKARLRGPL